MTCNRWCRVSAWVIVLSHVACGNEDTTRETVTENVGALCLTQAGSQITIDALLGSCERGGCAYASRPARCQASFDSARIVVTSRVDITIDSSPETCPDECAYPEATCTVMVPQEGGVTVVHGDDQVAISLPLASATPLFGGGSVNPCPQE
jgi:hypothetical protein